MIQGIHEPYDDEDPPEPDHDSCSIAVQFSEADIFTFIGFLSADIEELNGVEMGRLQRSWDRFKERSGIVAGTLPT